VDKKAIDAKKAELNLTVAQKDVEKQLEEYRSSLIIFRYKQKFIEQKLDTLISDSAILRYYGQYRSGFRLNHNVVKVLFVKIPIGTPDIYKVRQWCRSKKQLDTDELKNYCAINHAEYETFNGGWIPFTNLLSKVPIDIENQRAFLKSNQFIEAQDSLYHYIVKLNEKRLTREIAPLQIVKENVKSILLNKRKTELIDVLEQNIYKEALESQIFTIHEKF